MAEAHHRRKDPEAVRANLLAAAADLLCEGSPLSMAAVADAAGVTKGAVQHHFGTREALLAAMCETYVAQFQALLQAESAQEAGPGAEARSYVRAVVRSASREADGGGAVAILAASVIERSCAARWAQFVAESRTKDVVPGSNELIMRLAVDGLWLSDLLGIYEISPQERAALQQALLQLSGATPAP